jgi:hypothetical protein
MTPLTIVIIVVVIVLIFIILRYMFSDPYTLQGIANGTSGSKIEYSSLATNGSNAPATNFGYSIWFYVNDWNYRYGQPKVIFGRMGGASSPGGGSVGGLSGLDPCPAVVLGPIENNISVSLGCFPGHDGKPSTSGGSTVVHTCSIANVPLQRWVNLIISVYGRSMDLYINGKLVRTCLLPGIASVSPRAPIFVTPKGGFSGWTSKLQYFPDSLNPQQAWNIYTQGYKTSIFGSGDVQVQVSVIENGSTQSTTTLG